MAITVYVCTWGTGTATFYVEERPSHQPRVVGCRSPEAHDPAQSQLIQEARRQLKRHLNPPYRPQRHAIRRRAEHAEAELVWFPALEGPSQRIAS